ncbi:AraC family transcriptional regulator [Streptomyces sp. ITFR-16]|uniref:AraC family transcriptional regulator n=1 Tax=Streptomyces sp. ITFR-16 TaxID=3075198 RepID=UPI00288A88DB|nr:AraC family transcriptional regulator [Streptomyces sp. ITFR-16]WNI20499.1 AraC family transcriptional regulator [Streptomyces sp. ITFR-16]
MPTPRSMAVQETRIEHMVERAVQIIRERYAEPLSLDDISRAVLVSKFHLLRIFDQFTGVTPGRFLSAVRLDEAKRLLRNSDLGVATIACRVGYSSTGSFTRRFTESVGVPPTRYRRLSRGEGAHAVRPPALGPGDGVPCRLSGVARAAAEPVSPIYIGSFAGPILQGHPSSWTSTKRLGPFSLQQVPRGICYVHAMMRAARELPGQPLETVLLTATLGPLDVEPHASPDVELVLRQRHWSQPPLLFALPGLEIPITPAPRPGPK